MSDYYLFKSTLRDLLRPKRMVSALLLILLPVAIAIIIRSTTEAEMFNAVDIYNQQMQNLVFGFIIVILALVFSTGVITQEVEQKTIVYLLTRPIPRWRILFMKFLAAMTATVATAWLATLLLTATCFVGGNAGPSNGLRIEQIKNQKEFVRQLKETPNAALLDLFNHLPKRQQERIEGYDILSSPSDRLVGGIIRELNRQMTQRDFYNADLYSDVELSTNTKQLVKGGDRIIANRALLQDLFGDALSPPTEKLFSLGRDLGILPLAAFAYGALFLTLATLLKKPLMYGLMFAFGWETWVPNMPGDFQKLSLMSYLHILAPHGETVSQPNTNSTMNMMNALGNATEKEVITKLQSWTTLSLVIVIALVAALYLFSVREYVPRDDTD